jgi:hypothetical protein
MVACDGYGVQHHAEVLRPQLLRKLLGMTYDSQIIDCSAMNGNHVDTRPCLKCQRAVCNECRTHAVYCADLRFNPARPQDIYKTGSSESPRYGMGHSILEICEVCIVIPKSQNREVVEEPRLAHDDGVLALTTFREYESQYHRRGRP